MPASTPQHGLPDAAVGLVAACRDAGLPLQQAVGAAGGSTGSFTAAAGGAGELENLFVGSGQAARPPQRFNSCEGMQRMFNTVVPAVWNS